MALEDGDDCPPCSWLECYHLKCASCQKLIHAQWLWIVVTPVAGVININIEQIKSVHSDRGLGMVFLHECGTNGTNATVQSSIIQLLILKVTGQAQDRKLDKQKKGRLSSNIDE